MTHPPRSIKRTTYRILLTTVLTTVLSLTANGLAQADPVTLHAAIANPLDGITPDLSLFGPVLNSTWKRVAAAVWAVALAYTGVGVILAGMKVKKSRANSMSRDLSEGQQEWMSSLFSLGAVAAAAPLIGAVLYLIG